MRPKESISELKLNMLVLTIVMYLTRLIVPAQGDNRARMLRHFTYIGPGVREYCTPYMFVGLGPIDYF